MMETKDNPNSRLLADPPGIMRHIVKRLVDGVVNPAKLQKRRDRLEKSRIKEGSPHVVEYFHQLDDPRPARYGWDRERCGRDCRACVDRLRGRAR